MFIFAPYFSSCSLIFIFIFIILFFCSVLANIMIEFFTTSRIVAEPQYKGIAPCITYIHCIDEVNEKVMIVCHYHTWCLVMVLGLVKDSHSGYIAHMRSCFVSFSFSFICISV